LAFKKGSRFSYQLFPSIPQHQLLIVSWLGADLVPYCLLSPTEMISDAKIFFVDIVSNIFFLAARFFSRRKNCSLQQYFFSIKKSECKKKKLGQEKNSYNKKKLLFHYIKKKFL